MKNTFIFIFKLLGSCASACVFCGSYAQQAGAFPDSAKNTMNLDAMYSRPFLDLGRIPVAVGGYAEVNSLYENTDGAAENFSFQMRRMSLFLSSSVAQRIHFITEIEFEDGAREINLETAALDLAFHSALNLRAGILLNPIGSFNQNHDGPKWEFVDRPVVSTEILPATWSNAGAGFFGKFFTGSLVFAYEAYLTNGFDERIVSNALNRTSLAATKENEDRFEESFNGAPLVTAKLAVRKIGLGELGISWMGGVYNTFARDGLTVDAKRRVDVFAADAQATIPATGTEITVEAACVRVNIPATYTQQYGDRQYGAFIDFVQPLFRRNMLGFENAQCLAALRLEYSDWNAGSFRETGGNIADDLAAVTAALSWRPVSQTVVRFNYGYGWRRDLLGNPASRTTRIQVGLASYF